MSVYCALILQGLRSTRVCFTIATSSEVSAFTVISKQGTRFLGVTMRGAHTFRSALSSWLAQDEAELAGLLELAVGASLKRICNA